MTSTYATRKDRPLPSICSRDGGTQREPLLALGEGAKRIMATTCELLRLSVERGPNWLFLRLHPSKSKNYETLADQLWAVLSCHFIYRVVLELDEFKTLPPVMVDQLAELQSRIADRGGWLRLCGTTEAAQRAVEDAGLDDLLRSHTCRAYAVAGRDAGHGSVSPPHFEVATTPSGR